MNLRIVLGWLTVGGLATVWGCAKVQKEARTEPAVEAPQGAEASWNAKVVANRDRLFGEGRDIFRYDTFGSEAFWGDQLGLHRAIEGEALGGVGPGLTPKQALALGLKVDAGKVPAEVAAGIKDGSVNLDDPATTVALLRLDAVVGIVGRFDDADHLRSVGITCALCHATVDDSFAPGIGQPLDGWPNRDLDVGTIVTLAPNLDPYEQALGVDEATVKKVLLAWGPGRYDAELNLDGKGFRPDGKTAATVLPATFGLAGQNVHTYSGWGSIPYWNAYVANTQMNGVGTFVDRRLADPEKFPVAAKNGLHDKRPPAVVAPEATGAAKEVAPEEGSVVETGSERALPEHGSVVSNDQITSKLAALHFYQLAIPAPEAPEGSYDAVAAAQGEVLFNGKARCASCHVPPLFSEPGWPMHTPEEIGIDGFQASRAPDGMYRTTPLQGLFTRSKGGFYHDGRFADLDAVVRHYDGHLDLDLTEAEASSLVEYLKSL